MEIKQKSVKAYIFQYVKKKNMPNFNLKYLVFLLGQIFTSFCIEEHLLCDNAH